MEGLESLAGIQHSEDEPQERFRQLTGGERPLQNVEKKNVGIGFQDVVCFQDVF